MSAVQPATATLLLPRSNPDGWSVNARCLDDFAALDIRMDPFDGRDWEAHGSRLAHLSRD